MTGYVVYGYWQTFDPVGILYVGQGRDNRPYSHLRLAKSRRDADWHGNTKLIQRLRLGLAQGHPPAIVIIRDGLTRDAAEELERLLIKIIGRAPDGPLLNANNGVRPLDEPEPAWMFTRSLRRRDPLGLA